MWDEERGGDGVGRQCQGGVDLFFGRMGVLMKRISIEMMYERCRVIAMDAYQITHSSL